MNLADKQEKKNEESAIQNQTMDQAWQETCKLEDRLLIIDKEAESQEQQQEHNN